MPNMLDERGSTLTLPPPEYVGGCVGWERLAERIRCQDGIVAMVPDTVPDIAAGIVLPEQMAADRKPDVGTIISSGVPELAPGDRVLYLPWAGQWFRPFRVGNLQIHDMRFYGLVSGIVQDKTTPEPIEDCIPATVNEAAGLRLLGEWVLIRRDPIQHQSQFGDMVFDLPDDVTHRTRKAVVVAVGPRAELAGYPVAEGDRVVYNSASLVLDLRGLGTRLKWLGDPADYALIKASNLLCEINES